MTKRGLVSVVTPVYNGEAHVSRLLDSVLAQTYPGIEMILADDGSTEGTVGRAAAHIPKFEAKGYSLQIIRSPHKNASAAINAGLCHVTGQYLVWPDADDVLHPGSIARCVEFLEEHPEYRCVRSVMDYVSEETGGAFAGMGGPGGFDEGGAFLGCTGGTDFFMLPPIASFHLPLPGENIRKC